MVRWVEFLHQKHLMKLYIYIQSKNRQAVKKCAAPKKAIGKKDVKSKVAAKNGCDGRLIAKILITTIQLNLCCLSTFHYDSAPNPLELSSKNFCYQPTITAILGHHTSFFTMAFLGAAHFFYSSAVFGLDFTSFFNFMLYCHQWLLLLAFLSIQANMESSTCASCILII